MIVTVESMRETLRAVGFVQRMRWAFVRLEKPAVSMAIWPVVQSYQLKMRAVMVKTMTVTGGPMRMSSVRMSRAIRAKMASALSVFCHAGTNQAANRRPSIVNRSMTYNQKSVTGSTMIAMDEMTKVNWAVDVAVIRAFAVHAALAN
tara:strand:+ start:294 stop:734 length:441 start_codon:yes stop_codon:yes gene_type:complete